MTQHVERDLEADFVPGQLLPLTIKTFLGAEYVFPDMDAHQAADLVRSALRLGHLDGTQLTLVNATGACLTVPTRVIQSIVVDPKKLFWVRVR